MGRCRVFPSRVKAPKLGMKVGHTYIRTLIWGFPHPPSFHPREPFDYEPWTQNPEPKARRLEYKSEVLSNPKLLNLTAFIGPLKENNKLQRKPEPYNLRRGPYKGKL